MTRLLICALDCTCCSVIFGAERDSLLSITWALTRALVMAHLYGQQAYSLVIDELIFSLVVPVSVKTSCVYVAAAAVWKLSRIQMEALKQRDAVRQQRFV